MIRFLFYLAFGYIILKLLRVFIDPMFESKAIKNTANNFVPKEEKKASNLGDYVEYEEVK